MISNIDNIQQNIIQPQFSQRQLSTTDMSESLTSFDVEDNAIISSQANMLNELDKFNNGGDNLVDLAGACVIAKTTVAAEANVINAKKNMFDIILDMSP